MSPTAPDFVLIAHRIEIRHFNCFTSDILTPGGYVEEAEFRYDQGYGPDDCPPYMVIYDPVRRTCEEERKIIDEATDRTVPSSVFKGLPRLTGVGIHFRMTVKSQTLDARSKTPKQQKPFTCSSAWECVTPISRLPASSPSHLTVNRGTHCLFTTVLIFESWTPRLQHRDQQGTLL